MPGRCFGAATARARSTRAAPLSLIATPQHPPHHYITTHCNNNQHFDADGSGFITREELEAALREAGDAKEHVDRILVMMTMCHDVS